MQCLGSHSVSGITQLACIKWGSIFKYYKPEDEFKHAFMRLD